MWGTIQQNGQRDDQPWSSWWGWIIQISRSCKTGNGYHEHTKKPDYAWQTSAILRYSYDLFNIFPLFIICLFMSTFWGCDLLLLTCMLSFCGKWNWLTFALLWVLWHSPVRVRALLTVIVVDNSYWSIPSLGRWKYQWVPVITAKWDTFLTTQTTMRYIEHNCQ